MTADPKSHAILSPSFMHIALKCSGAVGLKEKLPPQPSTPAATKGTRIHEFAKNSLETLLRYKLNGVSYITPTITPEDQPLQDIGDTWRDVIFKEAFNGSVTGKAWAVEDKLTFSEKFSLWGTTDVWMVAIDERARRFGFIGDLKTGFIHVEAHRNPQLAAYAVALRQEIRDRGKDLDYVRAAIFQPSTAHEPYRETTFTSKQLDMWEKRFLRLAEEVFGNKAKFKVGEHCQYCPAQIDCKKYQKEIAKKTSLMLIEPNEIKFPDPELIPDKALVDVVIYAKRFESFIAACKKRVLSRLVHGDKIPGIKAVEGKSRRQMDVSRADALVEALEPFHITPFKKSLCGIGELEELLNGHLKPGERKKLVDSFTIRTSPPIILVPESDSRPAVQSKLDLLETIDGETYEPEKEL